DYFYTPTPGFIGFDSFSFRAYDGMAYSDAAEIAITVNAATPTADDGSNSCDQDGFLSGNVTGVDQQSRSLYFTLASAASFGTVTLTCDGGYSYSPVAGYAGPDSFTFPATNCFQTSSAGTITITVNDATPTADDGSNSGYQDGFIS